MALVAIIVSLVTAALGVFGLIAPDRFVGFIRSRQTTAGLYFATALRLLLGVALFFAAASSKAPALLRIVGVAVIVMGLATPFLGIERFRKLLDSWSMRGPAAIRGLGCFFLVIGLLLVYAIVP